MHYEAHNPMDLEQCNLDKEVYWILFLCDIGANMVNFERIICQSLVCMVEDTCTQECGDEKDSEKGKYVSTLELEECNALSVDKIEV